MELAVWTRKVNVLMAREMLAVLGRNAVKPIPAAEPVVRRISIEVVASEILKRLDEV